jgi:hypothetical protein
MATSGDQEISPELPIQGCVGLTVWRQFSYSQPGQSLVAPLSGIGATNRIAA